LGKELLWSKVKCIIQAHKIECQFFFFLQAMLTPENVVLAETGDSWFNCQKLRLPQGCGFEFQMQYGSIGWAVGATLGYAQAAGKDKRVISCIGDGSFQVMLGNRMPPKSAVECFGT
jgi:TPP-dependent 2-oxoacid decarboxylase